MTLPLSHDLDAPYTDAEVAHAARLSPRIVHVSIEASPGSAVDVDASIGADGSLRIESSRLRDEPYELSAREMERACVAVSVARRDLAMTRPTIPASTYIGLARFRGHLLLGALRCPAPFIHTPAYDASLRRNARAQFCLAARIQLAAWEANAA